MDRRLFLKSSAASVAILALPSLTGCSSTTIADLVQTLGNSASQIAAIEGNASLASKLLTDTGAAVTAIDNWKAGSPTQEVIEVLNVVEDDLNLFPITSAYAPLIDLAIATAESIIALLPASPAPLATGTYGAVAHTPHRHVQLGYAPPKSAKEYRKRFNAIVAAHPEYKISKLQ